MSKHDLATVRRLVKRARHFRKLDTGRGYTKAERAAGMARVMSFAVTGE